MTFERQYGRILSQRLGESPRFMIVIAGPRQIGKTTLVRQVLSGRPALIAAADQPVPEPDDLLVLVSTESSPATRFISGAPASGEWLVEQWTRARARASALPDGESFVLVIDEVQKIPRWSELAKGLWDADRAEGVDLHVVLLGSSPWLMQKGLSESLAGRYELIRMTHWAYPEM